MSDLAAALANWRTLPRPQSHWRRRSRAAMDKAILDAQPASVEQVIAAIDAAYPFGARELHPYKMWLEERKLLRTHIDPPELPPAPTDEDYAACEVAIDLVESGDAEAATKLLDEQAPRRLNRECPACGAAASNACFDKVESIAPGDWTHLGTGTATRRVSLEYRVVPHLSRVAPHKANGPLFGERP